MRLSWNYLGRQASSAEPHIMEPKKSNAFHLLRRVLFVLSAISHVSYWLCTLNHCIVNSIMCLKKVL